MIQSHTVGRITSAGSYIQVELRYVLAKSLAKMTITLALTGEIAAGLSLQRGGVAFGFAARPVRVDQVNVAERADGPERGQKGKDDLTPDSFPSNSADLANRLRGREPGALEELYELVAGRAFGLAYRILSDGASAEDIVQEAFLWVWNSGDRIDPKRGSVESLLMTVVHRRSIDALRARNRRDALRGPMDIYAVDENASDLFDSVAQSLTHERVRESVTGLSDDQRQVIELAYFSGLTHREISDQTGVPIGTVKSRLRLGMAKLRTAFGIGGAS